MKWQIKPISFYTLHLTALHPVSIPSVSLINNSAQIMKQTLCCSSKLLIHPDPTARITPPLCWLSQNSRYLHQFWSRSKSLNVVWGPNFRRDQLMPVLNFTKSLDGAEKGKKNPKPKCSIKKIRFFPALFFKLRGEPDCPSIQTPTDMDLTGRILSKNPLISQGIGTCQCLENPLDFSPFCSSWNAPGNEFSVSQVTSPQPWLSEWSWGQSLTELG